MSDVVDTKRHTIYVGNASTQVHDFTYLVERGKGWRHQSIQPGGFIKLSGEFDYETTKFIISQHQRYGMIEDITIDQSGDAFHGLMFAVDRPIRSNKLLYLFQSNSKNLVRQGEEIRQAVAIAQNEIVNQALIEANRNERVETFEVTIQQENHDPNDTGEQISVGLRVDNRHNPKINLSGPAPKMGRRGKRTR